MYFPSWKHTVPKVPQLSSFLATSGFLQLDLSLQIGIFIFQRLQLLRDLTVFHLGFGSSQEMGFYQWEICWTPQHQQLLRVVFLDVDPLVNERLDPENHPFFNGN